MRWRIKIFHVFLNGRVDAARYGNCALALALALPLARIQFRLSSCKNIPLLSHSICRFSFYGELQTGSTTTFTYSSDRCFFIHSTTAPTRFTTATNPSYFTVRHAVNFYIRNIYIFKNTSSYLRHPILHPFSSLSNKHDINYKKKNCSLTLTKDTLFVVLLS